MKKVLVPILALVLALGLAVPVSAAAPIPGTTTITFSANPAILSGDSDADVTIITNTTSDAGQPYIDEGKVTIQLATDGIALTPPVCTGTGWT